MTSLFFSSHGSIPALFDIQRGSYKLGKLLLFVKYGPYFRTIRFSYILRLNCISYSLAINNWDSVANDSLLTVPKMKEGISLVT